jgi:VanZ family protein
MFKFGQILQMFRRNIFSILVALVIMYLSLANAHTFDKIPTFNIPHFDKIVHFLMFFGLMSVVILENRRSINSNRRLLVLAIMPFSYGVLMEILQSAFTRTRTGDFFDACADLAGIIASMLLWKWIKPYIEAKIR